MTRSLCLLGLLAGLITLMPALSASAEDRIKICRFGADNQKLSGEARKSFITKCMATAEPPAAAAAAAAPSTGRPDYKY
jgi:hypothetical protein